MKLRETRSRGREFFFIGGKRVSNHDYSLAWLEMRTGTNRTVTDTPTGFRIDYDTEVGRG